MELFVCLRVFFAQKYYKNCKLKEEKKLKQWKNTSIEEQTKPQHFLQFNSHENIFKPILINQMEQNKLVSSPIPPGFQPVSASTPRVSAKKTHKIENPSSSKILHGHIPSSIQKNPHSSGLQRRYFNKEFQQFENYVKNKMMTQSIEVFHDLRVINELFENLIKSKKVSNKKGCEIRPGSKLFKSVKTTMTDDAEQTHKSKNHHGVSTERNNPCHIQELTSDANSVKSWIVEYFENSVAVENRVAKDYFHSPPDLSFLQHSQGRLETNLQTADYIQKLLETIRNDPIIDLTNDGFIEAANEMENTLLFEHSFGLDNLSRFEIDLDQTTIQNEIDILLDI